MLGDSSISAKKGLGSRKPVFSEAMENELVRHVKDMESMLFGFSPSQLRKVAYQYAEANEIDHPFSQEEKAAGIDWLKGFMSRHRKSLSLRTPEAAPTDIPDEAHHINAPDVPQPVTGPVVPQPVTGPVVPQPDDGPVDVPTINIRVVSPLPKVTSSVRRKASRSGKTCIITSSPYKRNLELEMTKGPSSKEVKKNTKESEPPSKKSKKIRSTTEEHGPTPSTSGTAPTSAQRKSSNTNAECLYCNERFSDSLPGEIWIQCSQCKEWAHQDCSGHEVGDFECEMCA